MLDVLEVTWSLIELLFHYSNIINLQVIPKNVGSVPLINYEDATVSFRSLQSVLTSFEIVWEIVLTNEVILFIGSWA